MRLEGIGLPWNCLDSRLSEAAGAVLVFFVSWSYKGGLFAGCWCGVGSDFDYTNLRQVHECLQMSRGGALSLQDGWMLGMN